MWVSEFASFMLATRGMMDTLHAAWQSTTVATSPTAAKITEILGRFVAVVVLGIVAARHGHRVLSAATTDCVTRLTTRIGKGPCLAT